MRVWICVDRLDAPNGRVWAVRAGNQWYTGRRVRSSVPLATVFRGRHAQQPKAYLVGEASSVTLRRQTISIA